LEDLHFSDLLVYDVSENAAEREVFFWVKWIPAQNPHTSWDLGCSLKIFGIGGVARGTWHLIPCIYRKDNAE